jgi:hypothetical protein
MVLRREQSKPRTYLFVVFVLKILFFTRRSSELRTDKRSPRMMFARAASLRGRLIVPNTTRPSISSLFLLAQRRHQAWMTKFFESDQIRSRSRQTELPALLEARAQEQSAKAQQASATPSSSSSSSSSSSCFSSTRFIV